MSYTRKEIQIHAHLAELYETYKDQPFIQFEKTIEVAGTQYLETIIGAIRNRKVLKLYYHPFYEDRPYFADVHPYLLKEYRFRWYLVGLNAYREQVRTYALDRIRDIQDAEGIPYIDKNFDAGEYFKHSIGIIVPEGPPSLIRLAVQKTQAQYLISSPWHPSQNLLEENDNEVIFSFRVHPTYEFKSLILGLGKDALVLEPESFRVELMREFRELAGRYQTG
ncbi:MAG: WYL domain-containing protein [Bacteroidales bacterium]|nr:WYL domain-containing protein [Bacteroidales bacterium]MBN2698487.1 WYL domain-containing protein [Bacteroidales bacterium]